MDMIVASPGVYFAEVQGESIILDLNKNRYFGLTAQSTLIWRSVVRRNDEQKAVATPIAPTTAAIDWERLVEHQLEAWTAAGLLSAGSRVPCVMPIPKANGIPAVRGQNDVASKGTYISVGVIWGLLKYELLVRRTLNRNGLRYTLCWLQRIAGRSKIGTAVTINRTMRAYLFIRRWYLQGKEDCLVRSIALAATLRARGIDADVCFGVQKFPFLAHAWVEFSGVAINDRPKLLRKYAVIARF